MLPNVIEKKIEQFTVFILITTGHFNIFLSTFKNCWQFLPPGGLFIHQSNLSLFTQLFKKQLR